MELLPCHCEAQGGWCEPRNEAIACYTGRTCIVRDCVFTSQVVHRNDIAADRRSKYGSMGFFMFTVLFCLLLSMYSWGQNANTQKALVVDKIEKLDSAVDKNALYVIDGELSDNKLNNIKPTDIFSIDILKKGEKNSDASLETMRDVVIVVTNAGAIKNYQRKFIAFSKEYKDYLRLNKGSDGLCHYFINEKSIDKGQKDFIQKLYEIPADKIVLVTFKSPRPIESFLEFKVYITTKQ